MARRLAAKSQTSPTPAPIAPIAKPAPASAPVSSSSTATLTPSAPGNGGVATRTRRVTHQEIAKRAYEIWVASGRVEGRDVQNWKQAEKDLGAV
ncbi:MAG: DUF2934 domain-containing protein [Planctomycetota bacterium]|nr:DUF2934 domain-containing protein [Planctomycetota bacterium]